MENTVKIFNEVYTESDVKKMSLAEISQLSLKIIDSVSVISHNKRLALAKNSNPDVYRYSSALRYLSRAQFWIAEIKRQKEKEQSNQSVNHWFRQIAKQKLSPDVFDKILEQALKNATNNNLALC